MTTPDQTLGAASLAEKKFAGEHAWPRRYGIAAGAVLLGWLARVGLTAFVGTTALPFVFFFPAVACAAWFGGLGAGLFAALASVAIARFFFIAPINSFALLRPFDLAADAAFLLSCGFIVGAIETMHRAQRQLVREMTERERIAHELRHARDSLATTLASIGDGVVVTDTAGQVTFLNAEAERLTRWSRSEAMGQPLATVFRIINEETRAPVDNPAEKALRLGRSVGLANHTILIDRDGTETPIDDSAAPIRGKDDAVLGVVLVFRDVTEARKADAARARLAAIVESSGDAIFTKNLQGTIETWNAGAEHLFGYSAAEIVGQSITRLVPPENLEDERQILSRLAAGVASDRMETVRLARDGRRIPVSVSVAPLRDREGRVTGASTIIHDISKRKEAEAEAQQAREKLARANLSLEEIVRVRTAELQAMVEEMEHVSYALTHDMRAPLRAMATFAELLLKETRANPLSPRAQDFCQRIVTGASRLDTLIRDALNYTRTVLQRSPITAVDLDRLIRGMIETYPNLHPEIADIRIEGRLPVVLGNESLLTQCFSNLLGNAVKFVGRDRRPQVLVQAERTEFRTKISIRDNGIGIPGHALPRLFRMFQKLDSDYEGTGVGLAIVRKVVEQMGGKVGVDSQVGQGSTFWVDLPLAKQQEAA